MAIQLSVEARNARLDAIETAAGATARLRLYSGAAPANTAAAATGILLADVLLPADYMSAASAGVKSKLGTWAQASATGTGAFGYYRIWDSTTTVCHVQGTAGVVSTDMIVDAATVTAGQTFTVTSYTLTDANA
jgi:hypothetical protein